MPSKFILSTSILLISACSFLWRCPDNPISPDNSDTTSHHVEWEFYTFGDFASCYLNDIAIIDENDIWAVGEIYLNDSLGNKDLDRYNAVHWNGQKWEVLRIEVQTLGQSSVAILYDIFVLPSGDIVLSSGIPYLPDGNGWKSYHLWDLGIFDDNDGALYHIWGTGIDNLYFGGNKGTLVHYDGENWQKIETGTTLSIYDIYGSFNNKSQDWEILVVASNLFNNEGCKIFRINGLDVDTLSSKGLAWGISDIWFIPNEKYYIVGDGIYQKDQLGDAIWDVYPAGEVSSYGSGGISGNGLNDVFIVGSYFEVVHYNGSTWYNYKDEIPFTPGCLCGIDIKDDLVAISGYSDRDAVIIIGKR